MIIRSHVQFVRLVTIASVRSGTDLARTGHGPGRLGDHQGTSSACTELIRFPAGAESSVLLEVYLLAKQAVDHGIAPLPVPEHGTPSHSLSGESGLFQRSLFGDVGDLRLGLDPVDLGMCEQVAGQLPLRVGTVTMAPCLRASPISISQKDDWPPVARLCQPT